MFIRNIYLCVNLIYFILSQNALANDSQVTPDEKAVVDYVEAMATGLLEKDEDAFNEIHEKANEALKKLVKNRSEAPEVMLKLTQKYKPQHVEFLKKEFGMSDIALKKLKSTVAIKNLCMSIIAYTEQNNGKLPDKLDDIKKYYKSGFDELIICPASGKKYVYSKSLDKITADTATEKVLIISSKVIDGTIKGFLDGHVEFIKDPDKK